MDTTFQRARSDEQRETRRQAILATVAAMLTEMPVTAISLNELSRRAGLAKSNVLRYFESREAILLELLDSEWKQWLAALPAQLEGVTDGPSLAGALTDSLRSRQVLCDLLSAQAGVLERNVSADVAARYKRAAIADVTALVALVREALPQLAAPAAEQLCAAAVMVIGAVWTHSQPSTGMLAAYREDPSLASFKMEFTPSLRGVLELLIAGALTAP
ncbi:TetR/AcrR family transcriptional regulator [Winogradskya humida]|nr:TetR/AcrR family transcriptional regulator [Actinoplanes humidus]